jgi:hypothetical protein
MDFGKILPQLIAERDLLDKVIVSVENFMREGKRGRGRPPGWMTKSTQNGTSIPQRAAQMKSGANP